MTVQQAWLPFPEEVTSVDLWLNVQCDWCLKRFHKSPSRLKKHAKRGRFCNKDCYDAAQRSGIGKKERVEVSFKICASCHKEKAASEFYKEPRVLDGLRKECKDCGKQSATGWQQNNPDKAKAKRRAWARKAYRQNPAKYLAKVALWRMKNRDSVNRSNRIRAKRVAELPNTLTSHDWLVILELFKQSCAFCGSSTNSLQMEHLIPVSRRDAPNPGTVWGNIVCACQSCNSSKGTKTLTEFCTPEKAEYITGILHGTQADILRGR